MDSSWRAWALALGSECMSFPHTDARRNWHMQMVAACPAGAACLIQKNESDPEHSNGGRPARFHEWGLSLLLAEAAWAAA